MRGAMWVALTLLGTPLAALAQQQGMTEQPRTVGQQQPAGGPSGAASIEQGQDSALAPSTGSFGIYGGPAIPGLGGVPVATPPPTAPWYEGGTGGSGTGGSGSSMNDSMGPTYRGTTPEIPSASPSYNFGSQPGQAHSTPTPSSGSTPSPAPATPGTAPSSGVSNPANTASTGQAETAALRQRVEALEREVSTLKSTTGGTGGSGVAAPAVDPGQVTVVTGEFDGTVRDVTAKHIDVVDRTDGTLSRLNIDDKTRAYKGSRRISVKRLPEGARVRTSFAYISGVEHARDIVVQSSKRKSQR